jgi:hypothetical protein
VGESLSLQLISKILEIEAYFLNIPKNMRSLEVSSGVFSVTACALLELNSEVVEEAAVEAGEGS